MGFLHVLRIALREILVRNAVPTMKKLKKALETEYEKLKVVMIKNTFLKNRLPDSRRRKSQKTLPE